MSIQHAYALPSRCSSRLSHLLLLLSHFRRLEISSQRSRIYFAVTTRLEKCDFRFGWVSSASETINRKQSIRPERLISLPINIFGSIFLFLSIKRKYRMNKLARKSNYQLKTNYRLKIDRCGSRGSYFIRKSTNICGAFFPIDIDMKTYSDKDGYESNATIHAFYYTKRYKRCLAEFSM